MPSLARNHFAALDSDDDVPLYSFGESVIDLAAKGQLNTDEYGQYSGESIDDSKKNSSTSAFGVDLAAIADELKRDFDDELNKKSSNDGWDFGSLLSATDGAVDEMKEMELKKAEEAKMEQDRIAERLALVHEREKDEFKEKINKLDMSHANRQRKLKIGARGTDFNDKLSTKAQKKAELKKRLKKLY